jgi:Protein of unknown function (DUF4239)
MSSFAIGSVVFALVFGSGLLGMFLRKVLPQHHLSEDSKNFVKIAMGMVATMTALVLGLLVSSAKSSFDAKSSEMREASSKFVLLDQRLAYFGPDAKEARDLLRSILVRDIDQREIRKPPDQTQIAEMSGDLRALYYKIRGLSPKDENQRSTQGEALSILLSLQQTRWLMYEQQFASVSMPMLIFLVSWLIYLFVSFGLFAPANGTTIASSLISALSVSSAIFLILDLYTPYEGLIRISSASLRAALTQLGN